METTNFLCEQFKLHGYRVTPQRRAILQVLASKRGQHPTVEQIYAQVRDAMPDMSPATVYNTVRELVKMDALLELDFGTGERHYDTSTATHAHLVCVDCGHVEDVFLATPTTLSTEQLRGFQLLETRITFRGYCPDCAAANR